MYPTKVAVLHERPIVGNPENFLGIAKDAIHEKSDDVVARLVSKFDELSLHKEALVKEVSDLRELLRRERYEKAEMKVREKE